MARPIKWRKIENIPKVSNFIPSDNIIEESLKNNLLIEELEAIRLKDLEGLDQAECASRMEVSRPTFQRILFSAREKVADSLVNGKGIAIEGGNYTRNICNVKCMDCGSSWQERYETLARIKNGQYNCTICDSSKVVCIEDQRELFCRGNCWRNGHNKR